MLTTAALAAPSFLSRELVISVDGSRAAALERRIWAHEPSAAPFPLTTHGGHGAISAALRLTHGSLPNVGVLLGVRGRFGGWPGGGDLVSMWEFGLRQQIELIVWRLRPWVGVGTSLGHVSARGETRRDAAIHAFDLSAGLRVQLWGPVVLGAFVETHTATTFAQRQELFSTWLVGGDVSVTFDLGPAPPPAPTAP
jgi:hypothetical protein